MRLGNGSGLILGILALLASSVSPAHAQFATYTQFSDAVPGMFFDADTSIPDPSDPNRLVFGFNSGRDPVSWRMRDFRASTAAFYQGTAVDTISVTVQAPAGFYVSAITYTQRGTGSQVRTGKAAGGATWVVGGRALDLDTFGTDPNLSATVDLSDQKRTVVPVSITTALFAYSTPSLGSASVAITYADLVVQLGLLGE
jgi:hypothetical protein